MQHLTQAEWAKMVEANNRFNAQLFAVAVHGHTIPNSQLAELGSFWSNPLKATKAFFSHPAKTIAHDYTAKKVLKTVHTVAPYAIGAAALYFGVPYLATSGIGSSVTGFLSAHAAGLTAAGSTAFNWWKSHAQSASQYISQLSTNPALDAMAKRAGSSVGNIGNWLGQQQVPANVAAQGQQAVQRWLAQQAMAAQGLQIQSPSAMSLLNSRLAAEQATLGMAAQGGGLPGAMTVPGSPAAIPKIDWTKYAPILIGIGGLVIMANK